MALDLLDDARTRERSACMDLASAAVTFRAACRPIVTPTNDPASATRACSQAVFESACRWVRTANRALACFATFRVHNGNEHRDAKPYVAAGPSLSRDAGIVVLARGLRPIRVFGVQRRYDRTVPGAFALVASVRTAL